MSGKAVKKQKLTPGGEAERLVKQCAGVLKAMQRNPAAGPFLAPVDWRALKLPTYPKMIKTPMDLGTVETKLNGGKYATVADFAADVELIFNNAKIFNTEGSDIFELADGLARDFDGRMEAVPLGPLREGGGGGGGSSADVWASCARAAALTALRSTPSSTSMRGEFRGDLSSSSFATTARRR